VEIGVNPRPIFIEPGMTTVWTGAVSNRYLLRGFILFLNPQIKQIAQIESEESA
jgi:hypothetical protein